MCVRARVRVHYAHRILILHTDIVGKHSSTHDIHLTQVDCCTCSQTAWFRLFPLPSAALHILWVSSPSIYALLLWTNIWHSKWIARFFLFSFRNKFSTAKRRSRENAVKLSRNKEHKRQKSVKNEKGREKKKWKNIERFGSKSIHKYIYERDKNENEEH